MSNAELVRGLYDAFAKGDVPAVLAALDENVEWTEVDGFPHGGTYIGRDAAVDGVFARIGSEWDPFLADMTEFLDAGDHVVAIGRYRGHPQADRTVSRLRGRGRVDDSRRQGDPFPPVRRYGAATPGAGHRSRSALTEPRLGGVREATPRPRDPAVVAASARG
jgi:ketosteroid isomerase-like protein